MMQPSQSKVWDAYVAALGSRQNITHMQMAQMQGTRPAQFIYDEFGFEPPVVPVTDEELDYVYESLGVRRKPPLPCQHTDTRLIVNATLRQCNDCHKTFPTPTNRRRR